jgi:transcriptional regulator with XRE-family HTH domain
MHFFTAEQRRTAEETKLVLLKLVGEYEVTQEQLALQAGVTQSAVSRYCNPTDETCHLPVFALANWAKSSDEACNLYACGVVDWLESLLGRTAMPNKFRANGSLDDEFEDAAINEGEFARAKQRGDIEKMEKIARRFQEIGMRMLSEVRELRRAQGHVR